jgi:predicted nucleic acid-binding protein
VALGFCFRDEQNEYAGSILERLNEEQALAPSLWVAEVANGILVAERRGRIAETELPHVQGMLSGLPVVLREYELDLVLGAVLSLARLHGLTVYDACYLHLAMVEGLPLATQDTDLRAAAGRTGVALA